MLKKLIYFLIVISLSSQTLVKKFKRYGIEDGLSQGTVRSIAQDPYGFLWFATQDGLNRFDGYNFKIYRYSQKDSNSIISSSINHIYSKGDEIWASGLNGTSRINIKTNRIDQFTEFYHLGDLVKFKTVSKFYIDSKKRHWAVTKGRLYKLKEKSKIFECVFDSATVRLIFERNNILYFGTKNGLIKYQNEQFVKSAELNFKNLKTVFKESENKIYFADGNHIQQYNFTNNRKESLVNLNSHYMGNRTLFVRTIIKKDQQLWIGTSDGLFIYHLESNEIKKYDNNILNKNSLSNNSVKSLYADHSGTVWVGTRNGLNYFSKFRHKFPHFMISGDSEKVFMNNHVRAFVKDQNSRIWVGTDNGVHIFSKNGKKQINLLKSKRIRSLHLTKSSEIIIGTRKGIFIFDKNNKLITSLLLDKNNIKNAANRIYDIEELGSKNQYFLASYNGLYILSKSVKGKWEVLPYYSEKEKNQISHKVILSLAAFGKDTLLIGTRGGFNILDLKSKMNKTYFHNPDDNQSISGNDVSDILVDSKKNIWVFTKSGINKFNRDSNIFKRYLGDSDINISHVYGATEDKNACFWLSTNSGIVKFNPNANTSDYHFNQFESVYFNYNSDDGLQGNEFNQGAFYKASDGQMFFGGQNGYNQFYPEQITKSDFSPNITLTSFKRFNKSVFLDSAFFTYNSLTLNHDDYVFTIEFSAMDYNNQKNVHYMYKLEGFNNKIINLFNKQEITYANINPGEYRLKIYASNADYIWDISKYKELKIIVLPPFWLQNWFISLVIVIILCSLYLAYRLRMRKVKENQQTLRDQVNEQTVELILMKNELLKINQIVHVINNETSIESLLQSLLNEMLNIPPVDRATAVVYHEDDDLYHYQVFAGWKNDDLKEKPIKKETIFKRYINDALELKPELFLKTNINGSNSSELIKSQLSLVIRDKNNIYGLIIFDNLESKYAFNEENLRFIDALKDHIVSAFYKVKLLDDLKRLHDIKNQFLGIAAHDLRNPLSMISGYASLNLEYIRMNQLRADKLETDLQMMIKTSDQMSDLLTRLLDITSIESGKTTLNIELFSLKALVSDTCAFHERMAIKKNIELIIDYESFEKIPKIAMDRIRISEVIDNLLTNAIKYTEPGGMVSMAARFEENEVVVRVKDTGLGLNKDELKYVFSGTKKLSAKPTAGESSTGLGLAIVKKIIDLHEGSLSVESEKGKGSLFMFRLPIKNHNSVNSEILL